MKIIDTDDFLTMPISARLLYYDLSMRADDEGFVDSPKKILRMVGASDDDLRVLIAKKYLILFDSGICVIRHWNTHNLIRADRLQETEYQDEKSNLLISNGKYELILDANDNQMTTKCQQLDNQMTTKCQPVAREMSAQVRLGKVISKLNNIYINNNKYNNKTISCDKSHQAEIFFEGFLIKNPENEPGSFNIDDYREIKDFKIPADNSKNSSEIRNALAKVILSHFNWVTSSAFRYTSTNLRLIEKCLSNDVKLADCFVINSRKEKEWANDPYMKKYLRIGTIYALKNFEQYIGEIYTNRLRNNFGEKNE